MPLTIGTAGHVDHGKTWLVRALTGKDTDRLPEERRRGISIDLGYAPLLLPDGRRLSLVDVPGHERFVRSMVAGATGIDLFLLVVDAAEGARPQTHEHLAVLRLLGVRHGVVAVTKSDAVDDETLGLAVAEARELAPGVEVVPVSARTGAGLDALRQALARAADATARREREDNGVRLYIDRSFTLHGIGTIVTGTLWSGTIAQGDRLRIEPGGVDVRVRSVHVHDEAVTSASAGQRVAVAVPAVERDRVRRGNALVSPGAFAATYRLDAELEELAPLPERAIVHHGTSSTLARIVRVGERFAQLRLAAPVVAARGDRFVIRSATTIGGGRVLDAAPRRHADEARFERLARGEDVIEAPVFRGGEWQYSEEWLAGLRADLEGGLDAADPLDPGVPVPAEPWLEAVLPRLGLKREGAKLYRPHARPTLGGREQEVAEIESRLGSEPIRVEDTDLARFLEREQRLVRVGDGLAVSQAAYLRAREVLVDELAAAGKITLPRFRDLLGTSRKTAQLLLERFDVDGLTRRVGDERLPRRAAGDVRSRA